MHADTDGFIWNKSILSSWEVGIAGELVCSSCSEMLMLYLHMSAHCIKVILVEEEIAMMEKGLNV